MHISPRKHPLLILLSLSLSLVQVLAGNTDHVRVVHVINSCHLDIGFADSAAGIINRYFDEHIPNAIKLGQQMRSGKFPAGYTDHKLNFMFQSWVLNFYLECPPHMGLHCPSKADITALKAAVRAGDVTWHAFPHNAQLEIMGKTMIEAGFQMTFALDDELGVPRKRTLSQRDVPGLTRSLVPILQANNVTAVTVGANDGSTPPDLPPCFLWRDDQSGKSIYGLFTWPGYGKMPLTGQRPCVLPGFEHALVYNWNGDNAGPLSAENYAHNFAEIQQAFPNAKVVASTFDNFTQHLDEVQAQLPVVTMDAADSWIYGVPSDPQKVARMMAVERIWERAATKVSGGIAGLLARDAVFRNATRFALKAGEHTWGKDVKKNLLDNWSWLNKDFERARAAGSKNASQYATLEESWWEQRQWGITNIVETLRAAAHPLYSELSDEFAALQPQQPSTTGYIEGKPGQIYTCGNLRISFDDATGAVSQLQRGTQDWAGPSSERLWGALRYRSYSAGNVSEFFHSYCKSNASWVAHDYGKPGLPASVQGNIWNTHLVSLLVSPASATGDTCNFVTHLSFGTDPNRDFGAPSELFVKYSLAGASGTVDMSVSMFNKTTTRLPEAMFVQFNPPGATGFAVRKLGEDVDYADVLSGASRHLHGISSGGGITVSAGSATMTLAAKDCAAVNLGNLTAYPSPVDTLPNVGDAGASFVLWDNLWGTNYVMWWPFHAPPPQYSASAETFPEAWTANILYRIRATLT